MVQHATSIAMKVALHMFSVLFNDEPRTSLAHSYGGGERPGMGNCINEAGTHPRLARTLGARLRRECAERGLTTLTRRERRNAQTTRLYMKPYQALVDNPDNPGRGIPQLEWMYCAELTSDGTRRPVAELLSDLAAILPQIYPGETLAARRVVCMPLQCRSAVRYAVSVVPASHASELLRDPDSGAIDARTLGTPQEITATAAAMMPACSQPDVCFVPVNCSRQNDEPIVYRSSRALKPAPAQEVHLRDELAEPQLAGRVQFWAVPTGLDELTALAAYFLRNGATSSTKIHFGTKR